MAPLRQGWTWAEDALLHAGRANHTVESDAGPGGLLLVRGNAPDAVARQRLFEGLSRYRESRRLVGGRVQDALRCGMVVGLPFLKKEVWGSGGRRIPLLVVKHLLRWISAVRTAARDGIGLRRHPEELAANHLGWRRWTGMHGRAGTAHWRVEGMAPRVGCGLELRSCKRLLMRDGRRILRIVAGVEKSATEWHDLRHRPCSRICGKECQQYCGCGDGSNKYTSPPMWLRPFKTSLILTTNKDSMIGYLVFKNHVGIV